MRRSRGYAPLPLPAKRIGLGVLAVGAHLKNTLAIALPCPSAATESDGSAQVVISQHLGDLETEQSYQAFVRTIEAFERIYEFKPEIVACDMHPDYLSSKYAARYAEAHGAPLIQVQHHHAHVAACMAENELDPPALGISWDGTGYGPDGTAWGGEFLRINQGSFERVAHFRHFMLPGGEAAIRQPRRTALGLLFEIWGERVFQLNDRDPVRQFAPDELCVLEHILRKRLHSPRTSSVGRLFDGVASIAGLCHRVNFEGQAAMRLEFSVDKSCRDHYRCTLCPGRPLVIDWEPVVCEILDNLSAGIPIAVVSARFHNTLADAALAVATRIGEERVILTGGCFQNRYLTETTVETLQSAGFRVYRHQRVPPNDGGIALGQIAAAAAAVAHGAKGRSVSSDCK